MLRLVLIALALCASASIAHSSPARLDRLDARSNTSHVSPESAIAPRRLETREFERRATSSRSKRAKKGLGINSQADVSAFGASVSWAYDWRVEERRSKRIDRRRSPVPPGGPGKALGNGVQFVPMLWGAKQVPGFAANVRAAVKANGNGLSPYLLGFNEPDLSSQSDLTPIQAAKLWKQQIEPVLRANPGLRSVSPAVTNGGGAMGVAWLKAFLRECTGCRVDAVAMHWYDSATNVNYFQEAQKTFAGRKIWITEFEGLGDFAQQKRFLNTVVPWLRSQPHIQRFAAFGLDPALPFVKGGKLTAIGRVYRDA